MKNFKKMAIALGVIAPVMAFSQTAPTGAPPVNNVNSQARAAWYRGGNSLINGANNIFGTMAGFNSPIYTYTNGVNRMIVNGDRTSNINGAIGVNTSGYVGIGVNSVGGAFPNGVWTDAGPFSLLHLNGPTGGLTTFNNNLGYRT